MLAEQLNQFWVGCNTLWQGNGRTRAKTDAANVVDGPNEPEVTSNNVVAIHEGVTAAHENVCYLAMLGNVCGHALVGRHRVKAVYLVCQVQPDCLSDNRVQVSYEPDLVAPQVSADDFLVTHVATPLRWRFHI